MKGKKKEENRKRLNGEVKLNVGKKVGKEGLNKKLAKSKIQSSWRFRSALTYTAK